MLKKVSREEFYFENEELRLEKPLGDIMIFYGNFSQKKDSVQVNESTYEIFHREKIKFPGSIKNPLHTLLRNLLSVQTVQKICSLNPDVILCEFLGTECLIDYDEPNPGGIFILIFEMALAVKSA